MGGNAIINSRRISVEEYNALIIEIMHIFPEIRMLPTRTYRTKETFGDIDFIVQTDNNLNIKQMVADRIKPLQINNNNMFYSFEYKGVQVDFNFINPENFLTMFEYSGNSDIGNFIGKVFRSINFKFGHDGLSYIFRYNDDPSHRLDVLVSKDITKILEFGGYDPQRWKQGFDTKEEIFEFVISSPLFNATYFQYESMNHNDRTRDSKRTGFREFLKFIEERKLPLKEKLTPEERMVHYERAKEFFGDSFHQSIVKLKNEYQQAREFREYFNGNIIHAITGLKDREVGQFKQKILDRYPNLRHDIMAVHNDSLRRKFVEDVIKEQLDMQNEIL